MRNAQVHTGKKELEERLAWCRGARDDIDRRLDAAGADHTLLTGRHMLAHRAVLRIAAQLDIWEQLFGSWSQSPADAAEAGFEREGEDDAQASVGACVPHRHYSGVVHCTNGVSAGLYIYICYREEERYAGRRYRHRAEHALQESTVAALHGDDFP